ncbi:hypothetical protein PO124_06800 [Bacillus licheniformis]|nr:hypothetical protein [Bacillus licheniformis]
MLEVGNNIQAIFGPRSDNLKSQMQDIMSGRTPRPEKRRTLPRKWSSKSKKLWLSLFKRIR